MSRMMCALCFVFIAAAFSVIDVVAAESTVTATCKITKTSGVFPIYGVINLEQPATGGNTTITVNIKGFTPGSNMTKHGFHVHQNGDLSSNCVAAGGHYNPGQKTHGGPTDSERHVGDLGNIEANDDGTVSTTIVDNMVSLIEERTVIGRAFVVHAGEDDLGRGNFSDSKTTGHAGARYGCCIIVNTTGQATTAAGPVDIIETTTSSTSVVSLSMALVLITVLCCSLPMLLGVF